MFMAPEIMRGDAYDERVDVYSFAMVLTTCLTRKDPYNPKMYKTVPEFIAAVASGRRPELPSNCMPVERSTIR